MNTAPFNVCLDALRQRKISLGTNGSIIVAYLTQENKEADKVVPVLAKRNMGELDKVLLTGRDAVEDELACGELLKTIVLEKLLELCTAEGDAFAYVKHDLELMKLEEVLMAPISNAQALSALVHGHSIPIMATDAVAI